MELEDLHFYGTPGYSLTAQRCKDKEHRDVALIGLGKDGLGIPHSPYLTPRGNFGEAIAYLCGVGIRHFVFDLRTLHLSSNMTTAIAVAINMRDFPVTSHFLGLDTTQTPLEPDWETKRHIRDWLKTIKKMNRPNLETAVTQRP